MACRRAALLKQGLFHFVMCPQAAADWQLSAATFYNEQTTAEVELVGNDIIINGFYLCNVLCGNWRSRHWLILKGRMMTGVHCLVSFIPPDFTCILLRGVHRN